MFWFFSSANLDCAIIIAESNRLEIYKIRRKIFVQIDKISNFCTLTYKMTIDLVMTDDASDILTFYHNFLRYK